MEKRRREVGKRTGKGRKEDGKKTEAEDGRRAI